MREKMIMDRNAREMAHLYISVNLGPVKRVARRQFRHSANHQLRNLVKMEDYDNIGPQSKNRLTGYDVA